MSNRCKQHIRNVLLVLACLCALESDRATASAGFPGVILAQAKQPNVPPPAPQSKLYVVEGIVVVALFAAAVFAVCRSSGRT